jgi:dTDP-4-dehydrorhamnose reductase
MSGRLRVLITGADGQVGRALASVAGKVSECRALGRAALDITQPTQVEARIGEFAPDVIINCAAYTAVDAAEQNADLAARVNVEGPRNLARAAAARSATRLLHISTDFVFDGHAGSPHAPAAAPRPLSVYGRTKLAGEQAVLDTLGSRALVVRTAWVYAALGRNFLLTMLKLMRERGAVRVVCDQIGTPTAAASVADVLWRLAQRAELAGVFHWTDAGVASWYDFAVAIAEEAGACGLLPAGISVQPIATAEYPTAAVRPSYSVLDTRSTRSALGVTARHWRAQLRDVMAELQVEESLLCSK